MWLLPVFSPVARLATTVFYRLQVTGRRVPTHGPVLLVANHPNSLLDPALVVAVAGRPVRFLAKAPLFTDPLVGWLVRGAGAIPVYRRMDDQAQMGRNEQSFDAAFAALGAGAAVGIFPEGISHSEPSLSQLRTGAARIALGAAAALRAVFPVVPIGLSFRRKERFRSEALIVVGDAVEWDDLASRGEDDAQAVRELTRRLDERLRRVTVNLEQWEDAPLVETAMEVYAVEAGVQLAPPERVAAAREVSAGLARLRAGERGDWAPLARRVAQHGRVLRTLGLSPATLLQPSCSEALRWSARQAAWSALLAPLAVPGAVAFYVPYRLTGWIVGRARPELDVTATYKVLVGAAAMLVWTAALLVAGVAWKGAAGAVAVVALLGSALLAVRVHQRWAETEGAARRFLVRGRRAALVEKLRRRQRDLAQQLARVRERVAG